MRLSPRELLLFAELWSVLRVPSKRAALLMQQTMKQRHKPRKRALRERRD